MQIVYVEGILCIEQKGKEIYIKRGGAVEQGTKRIK